MSEEKVQKVLNLQAQANNEIDLLGETSPETFMQLEIAADELNTEEQDRLCEIVSANQGVFSNQHPHHSSHHNKPYLKKEVWEIFEENQERNDHSENVVLLAKHYGSKNDLESALSIQREHLRLGHIPYLLMQERDAIQSKLYPVMKAVQKATQAKVVRKRLEYILNH